MRETWDGYGTLVRGRPGVLDSVVHVRHNLKGSSPVGSAARGSSTEVCDCTLLDGSGLTNGHLNTLFVYEHRNVERRNSVNPEKTIYSF